MAAISLLTGEDAAVLNSVANSLANIPGFASVPNTRDLGLSYHQPSSWPPSSMTSPRLCATHDNGILADSMACFCLSQGGTREPGAAPADRQLGHAVRAGRHRLVPLRRVVHQDAVAHPGARAACVRAATISLASGLHSCHLGCILLKVPAVFVRAGRERRPRRPRRADALALQIVFAACCRRLLVVSLDAVFVGSGFVWGSCGSVHNKCVSSSHPRRAHAPTLSSNKKPASPPPPPQGPYPLATLGA